MLVFESLKSEQNVQLGLTVPWTAEKGPPNALPVKADASTVYLRSAEVLRPDKNSLSLRHLSGCFAKPPRGSGGGNRGWKN